MSSHASWQLNYLYMEFPHVNQRESKLQSLSLWQISAIFCFFIHQYVLQVSSFMKKWNKPDLFLLAKKDLLFNLLITFLEKALSSISIHNFLGLIKLYLMFLLILTLMNTKNFYNRLFIHFVKKEQQFHTIISAQT